MRTVLTILLSTLTLCAAQFMDMADLATMLVNDFLQSNMDEINNMTKSKINAEGFNPWTPADLVIVNDTTSMDADLCDIDVDFNLKINKVSNLGTFEFTNLQVSDIKHAGDFMTVTVNMTASLSTIVVESSGLMKTEGCESLGPYGGLVQSSTKNLDVYGLVQNATLVASTHLTIHVIDISEIFEGEFCIKDATLSSSQISYSDISVSIPNLGFFEPLTDYVSDLVDDSQTKAIDTHVNNALESAVSGAVEDGIPDMKPYPCEPTEVPTTSPEPQIDVRTEGGASCLTSCPPSFLDNDECNDECNLAECEFDGGDCVLGEDGQYSGASPLFQHALLAFVTFVCFLCATMFSVFD